MPTFPDLSTLSLCSMMGSLAFAIMFLAIWVAARRPAYLLHWAASAALYTIVLELFTLLDGRAASVRALAFGVLAASDLLVLTGAQSFNGGGKYTGRRIAMLAAVILLPMLAALNPLFVTLAAPWPVDINMIGLAVSKTVVGGWLALDRSERASLSQRFAGIAILGYVPVYAAGVIATHLGMDGRHLAVWPFLADQMLLPALNIALMAMPFERLTRDLRDKALRDPLTGVRNRAWLEGYKAVRASAEAAVILVDIDHFKRINDHYGHAAGDEVLTNFAERASKVLEAEHGVLARLGGDEFIAIVPDADVERATKVAEDLLNSLRIWTPGVPMATASLGVAVADAGDDLSGVMARADRHLYKAKAAGRDRVAID